MMRSFKNETHDGNEKAVRRGRIVPDGDVNLAFARTPRLSPKDNVVVVDTSRIVEENALDPRNRRGIYYANSLGVLVDENDNIAVGDEFPVVSDVFSIDEDWSMYGDAEYDDESILPFVHISRYFHVDHSGLTAGTETLRYQTEAIKVVDGRGRDYLDADGHPRYRIALVAATDTSYGTDTPVTIEDGTPPTWAYRVHAYVDTDENEQLYLVYNKIELGTDGVLKNQRINYKEVLNPQPFFKYRPEESEVVDLVNRRQKIYSTKPVTLKEQVLGKPYPTADGYKVYVPKKAIGDTRVFQLFRWRINCSFTQAYKVDPTREQVVNCGIVVTNEDVARSSNAGRRTHSPYPLYNLSRSRYNANGVKFRNPAQDNHSDEEQKKAEYWQVNIDTDDLSQYDLLLWAPDSLRFDFTRYTAKINNFVSTHGGTLFIDTNSWSDVGTSLGSRTSRSVNGAGRYRQPLTVDDFDGRGLANSASIVSSTHELFDGLEKLGGWKIGNDGNNNEFLSMSELQTNFDPGYTQFFSGMKSGNTSLIRVNDEGGNPRTVTAVEKVGKGNKVISTFKHLYTCSSLFDYVDGTLLHTNRWVTAWDYPDYQRYINGVFVEGAMKFLFNIAMLAVKNRTLDDRDEESYSTSWTYSTPWKSSWVINAGDDVLSPNEIKEHAFSLQPRDPHADPPDLRPVWKRRLSDKSIRQLMDERLQPIMENPITRNRVEGSVREYTLEVTNPQVEAGTLIEGTTAHYAVKDGFSPFAWTEAYTPKFTVPVELGAHVVRDERDAVTGKKGRLGEYEESQYWHREYPDKPYAGQVFATFAASQELTTRQKVNWTATGTALETWTITQTAPPSVNSQTSDLAISWWDHPGRINVAPPDLPLSQLGTGTRQFSGHTLSPRYGMPVPDGIRTWQDYNYWSSNWGPGNQNFPYIGMKGRYLQGSRGEAVAFIQEAMNRFRSAGYFSTTVGSLKVDGVYGSKTKKAVYDFQVARKARYLDGVVDAETWSLIGAAILRGGSKMQRHNDDDHTRHFDGPRRRIPYEHISDSSDSSPFAKRSWFSNGPSIIWEMFMVVFDKRYKIHGVTVVPWLEGAYERLMFRSIDVRTQPYDLKNYNSEWGKPGYLYMPHRPKDGQKYFVPFGPYNGDTIIIGIGQDRGAGSGWGTARMLGIRDIRIHTRVTTTTSVPNTKVIKQQREINLTATGSIDIDSFRDVVLQLSAKGQNGGTLSNINWTTVVTDNPQVSAEVTADGKLTFSNNIVNNYFGTDVATGRNFPTPGPVYYSMDENGRFSPVPETGFVSKAEGIKLLCDANKKPVGFPTMPTSIGGANEYQRHYVKLTLTARGNDSSVSMGFYDFRRKEFIRNAEGLPEMSYLEYMERGPANIYIAVLSDFERLTEEIIPTDSDAPPIPYRWAMPVYGLYTRSGSKITLESLPENLGPTDMWPVAVREGNFSRIVQLRSRGEGYLTGYLGNYQGTAVRAFYGIPEAGRGGYSALYGPPNVDVLDEEPMILDDDLIQVRRTPILMMQHPTNLPSLADPMRPVFEVSKRVDRQSPWNVLPWSEIKDYNVSTGEIVLRTPLTSNDTGLVKVSYTSARRHFYFKRFGDQLLNLNAYSGHAREFLDKAIHIYIVPEYVRDETGQVIPESVVDSTLRFTTTPDIFDPIRPNYDPLAIQLGVIYMSTALDPRDIALLDTRRRGGGAKDNMNAAEVVRLVKDASTYWDINYGAGGSYQKGGFVIIRLPAALKQDFTEAQIIETIERNMTSGVSFKVEDLNGVDWSAV